MTKAKKLLALLLAVLTFVSVAVIGVSAEDAKTETPSGETTTKTETTTAAPTGAAAAIAKLFVEGATKKVVAGKIEITADVKSAKITVADTDVVDIAVDGTAIKNEAGEYSLTFADAHKVEKNEKGEITKASSKVETKVAVDGFGTFDIIFVFTGEDANGHRYEKSLGKTEPTHYEEGYELFECICGAQGRKNKVAKLPGKVTKVNGGVDVSVAKKGTYKIEPKIDMLGEPKYTVTYKSSDEKIATVNEKGVVTGVAIGKAVITCTVKDDAGNTVEDKVNVKVTYSLIQWILVAAEAIITGSVFVWDLILDALGLMK